MLQGFITYLPHLTCHYKGNLVWTYNDSKVWGLGVESRHICRAIHTTIVVILMDNNVYRRNARYHNIVEDKGQHNKITLTRLTVS